MHNRVGTPLRADEVGLLQPYNTNFVPGEIIARMINPEYYIISIYLEPKDANICKVMTSNHNNNTYDCIEMEVSKGDLIKINGNIDQTYKLNKKFAEDELLESYNIH